MKHVLLVFFGGGFGSVLRYLIGRYLNSTEDGIPYGTFAANILGSLLIGIILGLAAKNDTLSQSQTLLLATGFCGGFTTFSTFAYENHVFFKIGGFYKFCTLYCSQFYCWIFSRVFRYVFGEIA